MWSRKPQPIKDYIYVSKLKAERLSSNLTPKMLNRLKSVDIKVGPVGAGITLTDAPNQHVIKVVEAVDEMIRESTTVRHPADDHVVAGHYIGGTVPMVFGVQKARGTMAGDAAVFLSGVDTGMVCLVGSAAHMLDRRSTIDVGECMSVPSAAYDLLSSIPQGDVDIVDDETDERRLDIDYALGNLYDTFCDDGEFAMSFLAKVHRRIDLVDQSTGRSERYTLASPLWVASDTPD